MSCRDKGIVVLGDIPEMQSNKVMIAFTGAMMGNLFNQDNCSKTPFIKVKLPFGAMEVRYTTIFGATNGQGDEIIKELFIVVDKKGVPRAFAVREFDGDSLNEDSIGFFQYEYRSYHQEGVIELIKKVPHPLATLSEFEVKEACDNVSRSQFH